MREDLTNICGLSAALRLSIGWLDREAKARRIPFLDAGGTRLFNVEAVRRSLAERAALGEFAPAATVAERGT